MPKIFVVESVFNKNAGIDSRATISLKKSFNQFLCRYIMILIASSESFNTICFCLNCKLCKAGTPTKNFSSQNTIFKTAIF